MKITFLISISVLIISCSESVEKTAPDIKAKTNLNTETTFLKDSLHIENLKDVEDMYVQAIWNFVEENYVQCDGSPSQTYKDEEWTYCDMDEIHKVVTISNTIDNVEYNDHYLLRNEKLIFAVEWTKSPANVPDEEATYWNCEYIVKDSKVLDIMSLGHGDTESDDWDNQRIIPKWNKRKMELSNLK